MLCRSKYVFSLIPLSVVALGVHCQSLATESSRAVKGGEELSSHKLTCQRPKNGEHGKPYVLVSCGSFNPPTLMHLRMFECGRDYLRKQGLDVLGGYMSPVHKGYGKKGLLENDARIELCEKAVETSDWIMVDCWEASQPQHSTTLPVLQSIRHRLADKLGMSLTDDMQPHVMLLCGTDLLESFTRPGVWAPEDIEAICRDFGVVCITRPGSDAYELISSNGQLHRHAGGIHLVSDVVDNPLSSTAVRDSRSQGRSIKYLVPDEVKDVIEKKGYYCS